MKSIIILISLTIIPSVLAAAPKELSLGRTAIKMAAEGIEFKPFRDMKPEQIKPIEAETLISTNQSGQKTHIEVYDYNKLWMRDQKIATYMNKGISVTFYKLNYLQPKVPFVWKSFVKEDAYRKAVGNNEWDESNIQSWFKSITGKSITLENKYPKLTFSINQRWVACGQNGNQFDFLLYTRDKRFYYLHAEVSTGTERDKVKAVTDFVKYIRINKAKTVAASNQSSKIRVNGNNMSEAYKATVKKVIQEVANTKGWWYAQTPNYILKSNLDSRGKTLAKRVQVRVEVMRKAFEIFLPPKVDIEAISVITFPNTREEYMQYSDAPGWSAGVWNPRRKELVVSVLQGSKRQAEAQMMSTLHHEAFHQYLHYALGQKQTPTWLNEGHAEMFSSVKVIGDKVTVIEDKYALGKLSNHLKRRTLDLTKLINVSHEGFYANKDINYPLSWSLVYFLRKAGPLFKAKGYDQILPKIIDEVAASGNVAKANEKGFYQIDMTAFQKDFYDFWNSRSYRSKAAKTKIVKK